MPFQYTPDIAAFVEYFVIDRNKSAKTAREYARDVTRFARFVVPTEVNDASTEQIEEFLHSLRVGGRNKPQSVLRKLAALTAYFKFLVKKKIRLDNPAGEQVERPKCARPLPQVMSEAEVECLLSVQIPHRRWGSFLHARNRALMQLLWCSGLRRFEACGLDVLDVDLVERKVRVRHGKGDKERYSYLSDVAIDALRDYLAVRPDCLREPTTALFLTVRGARISPRQLWCVFRDLREAAKERGLHKHVVPHTLRHSFATHIYRRSHNIRAVQKLLGHSNINTTERYTHIEDAELRDIHEACYPRAV